DGRWRAPHERCWSKEDRGENVTPQRCSPDAWQVIDSTGNVLAGPFKTNAAAWRWIDRQNGEPISRSEGHSGVDCIQRYWRAVIGQEIKAFTGAVDAPPKQTHETIKTPILSKSEASAAQTCVSSGCGTKVFKAGVPGLRRPNIDYRGD